MNTDILLCILIPFVGTTLGAAGVFLLRRELSPVVRKALTGFASGVMVAASVWSLLIPALDAVADWGRLAFIPAAVGLALGFAFLLLLDDVIPHLHAYANRPEGLHSQFGRTTMLCLAVTLHNIPEGMAVGVVCAGLLDGGVGIDTAAALTLALGIAIQNFPEGAIVSMPLAAAGGGKIRSFALGTLSGIVEPLAALLTVAFAALVVTLMPYLLSFAAGAMLYVVVEELIPATAEGAHSNVGTVGFAFGFILMMCLDCGLG